MSIAIEDTKAGSDTVTAWKLVPVEPTWGLDAMSGAGADRIPATSCSGFAGEVACNVYRAMVAAAPTPPPSEGIVDAEEASDRIIRIGALIEELSGIRDRYGNTCVYIRRGGLSWGAVAMNREADDKEHGVFELQAQHDRDMTARAGQVRRLIDDRNNCRDRAEAAEAREAKLRERLVGLEKAATEVSRLGAVTGPQWSKLSMAILGARAALTLPPLHERIVPAQGDEVARQIATTQEIVGRHIKKHWEVEDHEEFLEPDGYLAMATEIVKRLAAATPTPPPAEGIVAELRRASSKHMLGAPIMADAADEIERLQGERGEHDEYVAMAERRAESAEAELASIKAGPIVYGRVPPARLQIVPAQGDEVAIRPLGWDVVSYDPNWFYADGMGLRYSTYRHRSETWKLLVQGYGDGGNVLGHFAAPEDAKAAAQANFDSRIRAALAAPTTEER